MQKEHPLDRLARRFRGLIILMLFISAPIMLLSYGWMMVQSFKYMPGWLFSIVFIAHLFSWLGISSLFDSQQER